MGNSSSGTYSIVFIQRKLQFLFYFSELIIVNLYFKEVRQNRNLKGYC